MSPLHPPVLRPHTCLTPHCPADQLQCASEAVEQLRLSSDTQVAQLFSLQADHLAATRASEQAEAATQVREAGPASRQRQLYR